MAIERLTISEGCLLEDPSEYPRILGKLLISRIRDIEPMDPGEYVVTPKIWTNNLHQHELIVLENGEGLYRIRPRGENIGFIESRAERIGQVTLGGTERLINADSPRAIVAGGHPKAPGIHIFELFFYH